MSIIYNKKNHMYVGEVNPEDGTVISFTSSVAYAEKFDEGLGGKSIIEAIKNKYDVEVIELD